MVKPLISIIIPAYNEAANIQKIITAIFSQHQASYSLGELIVISDGSDDQTVELAQALNHAEVRVVEHGERAGKSTRLNEGIRLAKNDIVVIFDADINLVKSSTIDALISPILHRQATLVSGHPVKTRESSFTDHVMDVSQYLQDQIKTHVQAGNSVYACHGRILALRQWFFKDLKLPVDSIADDAYLYFLNKTHGGIFAYANDAVVSFKMPQNFPDFAKQQRRFSAGSRLLNQDFNIAYAEYQIPLAVKLKILSIAVLKFHIYAAAYIAYQILARFVSSDQKSTWEISHSTKNL